MTQRQARAGEVNGSALDRFTLVHFASGTIIGLVGTPIYLAVALGAAWEVVENPLKDYMPDFFPNPTHDSPANAVCDFLAFSAGAALGSLPWVIYRAWRRTVSPLASLLLWRQTP